MNAFYDTAHFLLLLFGIRAMIYSFLTIWARDGSQGQISLLINVEISWSCVV